MLQSLRERQITVVDALALGLLLLLFAAYAYNLTGRWAGDDEGGYLYQVWRMSSGELPYRDFMTPQLPVFLYAGAFVMQLAESSVLAMRFYSVVLTLATAMVLFMVSRRHANSLTGLLAILLFLLHPDIYLETRLFRNEATFLFLVTAGLAVALWPVERPHIRNLVVAGVAFGLSTMVKLFGLLPAAGVELWLLWDWVRNRWSLRELVLNTLSMLLAVAITVGTFAIVFSILESTFFDLVLGHHLAQGSQTPLWRVIQSKIGLYGHYFRLYPLLVTTVILSAVLGFVHGDLRRRWAFQLFTAGAFLVLSRDLVERHFIYLLPSLCLLAAWLLADSLQGRYRVVGRLAAGLIMVGLAVFWLPRDLEVARRVDEPPNSIIKVIQERVEPGEAILVDDPGLAFHAGRRTTYAGAALSQDAAESGQITGELLIDELVDQGVKAVVVDETPEGGDHLFSMRDYPRFHRFLERNYEMLGYGQMGHNSMAIWVRDEVRPWKVDDEIDIQERDGTSFGETISLVGYSYGESSISAGDSISVLLFWQADQHVQQNWKAFVHLVGPDGTIISQHDKYPYDGLYPTNRWWPGQIIDDSFEIYIPADAQSGDYKIAVGMYDELTGERISIRAPSGLLVSDSRYFLPSPVTID